MLLGKLRWLGLVIVDEGLFMLASTSPDELFKVVMFAGLLSEDFAIEVDASKRKGSKLLENMRIHIAEEWFNEVYGIYGFIPAVVGKMHGKKILELARVRERFVYRIEPVREVRACLKDSIRIIHADKLHERGVFGERVKVGVIDTGVDPSCSLEDKVISYRNFVPEEEYGDYNGHGTHVAGIIAGDEEIFCGVAPKAQIISSKVLNREGSGDEHLVAEGMMWAYVNGAEIMNLSFGGPGGPRSFLSRLCDALTAKNVVVIAAAGNGGPEEGTIQSPGSSESTITVGAVDKKSKLTRYSSRGPVDGIIKPDLLAPGGDGGSPDEGIISTRSHLSRRKAYPDECHTSLFGTSMAAPHVSGSVALILEVMNRKGIQNVNKHFFIKNVLMSSATNLGYRRNEQGAGLINVEKALAIEAYAEEDIIRADVNRVTGNLSVLVPSAIIGISSVLLGAMFHPRKQDVQTFRQELYSQIDNILCALDEKIHKLNEEYKRAAIPPNSYSEEMMKISRILLELNELIKRIK